ncbi:MAG TPA: ATP-binding protein, partial [Rhizomicrobium sp.]|nr:ATP-binding protein [Rhizomicrobium sp.]
YTNLPPGDYRFRVIASNNSGVWNMGGATLAFSIAPAYWQTNWFRALCAALLALMLAAIYQLRMRRLAQTRQHQHELNAELAHANRVATLGQLTASIAHEVSQPLSATIANAHAALRWLKAEPANPLEAHLALDRIVQEGNRAADIVTRIRGLVKKTPGQEGEVFLNDEIRGIMALTRSEADRHSVEMRTELSPDLPVTRGDRVQLQQVLLNLAVNAIEATGDVSDGPRNVVMSSERDGGGGVVVSVRDTGPGLAPEAAARLFEPFYTTKQNGLGMGLSICRSIIEAHGGQLWVTANTPRGAIFHFTLPPRRTGDR